MLDPEHRHYLCKYRRYSLLDCSILFQATLYHIEMIELRPRFRNAIAGLCAALAMGCHTTRNVNLVENPDATTRPSRIEVVTKNGSSITVFDPIVRQDSVRGFSDDARTAPVTVA